MLLLKLKQNLICESIARQAAQILPYKLGGLNLCAKVLCLVLPAECNLQT